jgi:hypothetical protein
MCWVDAGVHTWYALLRCVSMWSILTARPKSATYRSSRRSRHSTHKHGWVFVLGCCYQKGFACDAFPALN